MTAIVLLMALAGAGWLQAVIPAPALLGHARPPVLTAVVVAYAAYFPAPAAITAAVLAGIVYDANGLMPLGVSSLFYCIAAAMIRRHALFWREAPACAAALTAAAHFPVIVLAARLFSDRGGWLPGGWLRHLTAAALMGAATGALAVRAILRLHRMTGTLHEDERP